MLNLFFHTLFLLLILVRPAPIVAQDSLAAVWADSRLKGMSIEEKIGQLFIIRAHSDLGDDHMQSVSSQIRKYHVGGLCFFQGTPEKQAALTTRYQTQSKVPLMITMDAEWGLGMRFKDKGLSFPRQLMLGAIQDERELEAMGFAIGQQLKALGVHVSFAPVADINNNPLNPVIGDRSFGEDREKVAQCAIAYMRGLEAAGVMACGKHFPGHGDTDTDSHLDLPLISHSMERLTDVELYPFKKLIEAGMTGMMVAHLHVPALDDRNHISTTLSVKAVQDLLKNEMGFKGLIFTDALEMKGVTKHFNADEVAIMAFEAGNDMLVLPENMDLAFKGLKEAFTKNLLDARQLDDRVRRILIAKYKLGLHQMTLPDAAHAAKMAFNPNAIGVKHKLIELAVTVAQNKRALIPIVNVTTSRTATLALGSNSKTHFQSRLDSYMKADHYHIPHTLKGVDVVSLLRKLKAYDRVLVSIHHLSNKPSANFGLTKDILSLVQNINRQQEIILTVFGNPYALKYFENIDHVIMAYEDSPEAEDITAQGLMGVFGCKGKLPVSASNIFPVGHGYMTPSLERLGYSVPERVGMNSDSLHLIRRIAEQMIRMKAAPGCEVLIAREGRIIYREAFGQHTYEESHPVYLTDLYDVASLTKVAATTLSIMRLDEEGIVSLDASLGDYLSWLEGSNKKSMTLRKVMSHHAGLQSYIPFFEKTIPGKNGRPAYIPEIYCDLPGAQYCISVAPGMYMDTSYLDDIRKQIRNSPLNQEGQYVYSDLGFIMLAEIIRLRTGVTLDHYVDSVFYKPMGLDRIGFLPLKRFATDEIVPTEVDSYFRQQMLKGYVHDMSSAMLGGVSGHAGLFSNAEDLAALFQMLMNGGEYGGQRYVESSLLDAYTTRYKRSTRRGTGFDMKELNPEKNLLTAREASERTYGHTGFTGVCAWNDPETRLVYIFLSNRTFPTMRNDKLKELRIREKIHSRAYKAIQGYKGYTPSQQMHG